MRQRCLMKCSLKNVLFKIKLKLVVKRHVDQWVDANLSFNNSRTQNLKLPSLKVNELPSRMCLETFL